MLTFLLIITVFFVSIVATLSIKKAAIYFNVLDHPNHSAERKIHRQPVPLLGGVAVMISFFIGVALIYLWRPTFITHITPGQMLAVLGASVLLMIGGYFDDKFNLPPLKQLIFPLLAVILVVVVGVNLKEITNPLGGKIDLLKFTWWGRFVLVDLIVFFWLLGMMYTTKLLDGLDGLVTGLTIIGSCMIGFLSLTEKFYQPDIALLSFLFATVNLGFLIFNFYPAKIFLGEGGSLFAGFILGILAIIAGGKIATALLVMGLAIIDLAAVIVRRLLRSNSPFFGDSGHLHYRLLKAGLSQRQAVIIFYCLAGVFGVLTLFLQSKGKLFALLILLLVTIFLSVILDLKNKKNELS
ncbi:MAG: MraY family glycosyltransferase [Candidatus Magasanikbacteria bacterium]|nr:MraY family glycosyltransferase [Candidatus Magasanikbacteria bacterium]